METAKTSGDTIISISPVDGKEIGSVVSATEQDYQVYRCRFRCISNWRMMPAPQRGEIVRQLEALRSKEALGALVSYEMGGPFKRGLGKSK